MSRALASYVPALLCTLLLLWIGSRTHVPVPRFETGLPVDKVGHFLMYGVLGALAGLGWLRSRLPHQPVWPILVCLLVGLADELHQIRVPGRSAEFGDWVADAAGILVGFLVVVRVIAGRGGGAKRRAK